MVSELNEWRNRARENESTREREGDRDRERAERWKLNFDNLTSIGAL